MSKEQTNNSKTEEPITERFALTITAAFGIALSAGVIASLIYLLMALAPLIPVKQGFAQVAKMRAGVETLIQYRHPAVTATMIHCKIESASAGIRSCNLLPSLVVDSAQGPSLDHVALPGSLLQCCGEFKPS